MLVEGLLARTAKARLLVKCAAHATAVAVVTGAASMASAAAPPQPVPLNNQFFDWQVNNHSGFVSSPFLSDTNAGSVNAFLAMQPTGAIRAVKVTSPISNATAKLIFDNPKYHVSYVLGDLEGVSAVSDAAKLSKQVQFVN